VIDFNIQSGHTVDLFNRMVVGQRAGKKGPDRIGSFLQDTGKPQARILMEELAVSEIFSALQVLELEQRGQHANTSRSRVQLVASTVGANDFSVLREFVAPRADGLELLEQQFSANQEVEHATLETSTNDFSALEERIVRVAEIVKQERQERTAAEERALHAETEMSEQALRIEALKKELSVHKSERHHAHQRVERMLNLLDSLEL
jgi:hypothetical protein